MSSLAESRSARYERGLDLAIRLGIVPALAEMSRIAPAFSKILVEHSLGDVLSRPGLDLRTREIALISILATLGDCQEQLAVHVAAGLDAGLSSAEISEVLLQISTYAGYPRAINAIRVVGQVFDTRDVSTPPAATGRAVVCEFLDAIERRDLDAAVAMLDPQVSWQVSGDPATLSWAGRHDGPAAVRRLYRGLADVWPLTDIACCDITASGERVYVAGQLGLTSDLDSELTEFVDVFLVRDGLICRCVMYLDSHSDKAAQVAG